LDVPGKPGRWGEVLGDAERDKESETGSRGFGALGFGWGGKVWEAYTMGGGVVGRERHGG
jgi:hypothetical protein